MLTPDPVLYLAANQIYYTSESDITADYELEVSF